MNFKQVFVFLTNSGPEVLYVATDAVSGGEIGFGEERIVPADFGLHELRCDIQQGRIRIGNRRLLICMLGRADVVRARKFPAVLEKFLRTCETFAPNTYIIMGGPFPEPGDQGDLLARMQQARNYLGARAVASPMVRQSSIAFRYGEASRGLNFRLMRPEGLTERGWEVLGRDLLDIWGTLPF